MTTQKSRAWPLAEAQEVAEDLITLLRPACERIEIAGSVRRKRPDPGDIELLVIPKEAPAKLSHWAEWAPLEHTIWELIRKGILDYRLNKKGSRTFGPLNKRLIHVPSGIPVDLFSTTIENYGMSWVMRTGPKEFNIRMMSRFQALHLRGHAYGGVTDQGGKELPCPTEEEVFRLLGWPYQPPEARR